MSNQKNKHVVWHTMQTTRTEREKLLGQKGCMLWLSGLSGSGKSTVANLVEKHLYEKGYKTYLLDGDNIRHGLCKDLTFTLEDRKENIRRIGEVGKLFVDAGIIVLGTFISPLIEDRETIRTLLGIDFIEIFVDCPIEVCIARDPKGLYDKALKREIENFTGISSPYEKPNHPELTINTHEDTLEQCVDQILMYLKGRGLNGLGTGI